MTDYNISFMHMMLIAIFLKLFSDFPDGLIMLFAWVLPTTNKLIELWVNHSSKPKVNEGE